MSEIIKDIASTEIEGDESIAYDSWKAYEKAVEEGIEEKPIDIVPKKHDRYEFNVDKEITNGPLNELHVGPTAPETYVYETNVTTSVHALPTNKITISPNPFVGKTQITFQSNTEGPIIIELFNATGQLISTETMLKNSGFYQHEIQMSQTGLFFCIIESNLDKQSFKLISK